MTLVRRWNSLIGVAADHLQVFTFLGLSLAGLLGFVAWVLAKATKYLQPYAPISYLVAAVTVFLAASVGIWLVAAAVQKISMSVVPTSAAAAAPAPAPAPLAQPRGPWIGTAQANMDVWRHVDPLTLEQAACLWAGIEPPPVPDRALTGAAAARLVQLSQAAAQGRLGPVQPHWIMIKDLAQPVQPPRTARVTREQLIRYAESIGEKPPFLDE